MNIIKSTGINKTTLAKFESWSNFNQLEAAFPLGVRTLVSEHRHKKSVAFRCWYSKYPSNI